MNLKCGCRLPLELAPLCDASSGFAAAVATVLEVVGSDRRASAMSAGSAPPLSSGLLFSALVIAGQAAEAQLQLLLQLQVLLQYVLWSRSLGEWSPSLEESQQINDLVSKVEGMQLTAAITRWSLVTPLPSNEEISNMDAAQLSAVLRIGEPPAAPLLDLCILSAGRRLIAFTYTLAGGGQAKAPRTSALVDTYVAGILFSELIAGGTPVGDLSDLQQLGAVFVRTLLGIQDAGAGSALAASTPTTLAVGLARLLFRDRQAPPMLALLRMVQGSDDIRLLFFQASPQG